VKLPGTPAAALLDVDGTLVDSVAYEASAWLEAWRPFRRGVIANLANPISVIFFSSIFAAVLPPELPVWVRAPRSW
jgi:amino acid exporter